MVALYLFQWESWTLERSRSLLVLAQRAWLMSRWRPLEAWGETMMLQEMQEWSVWKKEGQSQVRKTKSR